MPMYTYHCESCDHEFEKYQSFSEDALTTCPNCGQEALYKVYKPALVLFKGSGYYVTDSKSHNPTLDAPNNNDNHNHKDEKKPKNEKTEKKKEDKTQAKSSEKSEAAK